MKFGMSGSRSCLFLGPVFEGSFSMEAVCAVFCFLCGNMWQIKPQYPERKDSVQGRSFEVSVASTSGIFVPAFSLPLQLVASSTPKMSFLFDV